MSVSLIPFSKDAVELWPQVSGWLDEALTKTHSLMTTDDLLRNVRNGSYRLWVAHHNDRLVAAFVTEIVRGGRGGAVNVLALGGSGIDEWLDGVVESLDAYARANDCVYVVEMGRSGWNRVLAKRGWVSGPCVMMKVTR